jgi:hypothetical protein
MRYMGHCRFSWFGISDTGRTISDLDIARRLLWHPYRMAVRFYLFENIMLPSIKAQTDQDFEFEFITSSTMPEPYLERLQAAIADWAPARLLLTEKTDIGKVMRPTIEETTNDGADPAVHFRLDDDDALSQHYIARLKAAAERQEPGCMISFPKGVLCFTDGTTAKHDKRMVSCIAIGLALLLAPGQRRGPFLIQHRRHWQRSPTFMDPSFYAYQNTFHGVNNTKGYEKITHLKTSENDRITARFSRDLEGAIVRPGLDDEIARAFPFSSGPALRQHVEHSLQAAELCEEMGFSSLL